MKAALVAVGTELTTGQIVNKNGSWISERLKQLGVDVTCHIVVPDDKAEMHRALDFCNTSDLVFVTGGLGPTSDDFTRDVIAEKAKAEMFFDEHSWKHVSDRLTSRGFTVKEIQRQQCYFPRGSTVLVNAQGTANGFMLPIGRQQYFVLPGPPREIEAIWNASIQTWLEEKCRFLDKKITRSWDTLGVGESDVAVLVEEIFKDKPATLPIEIGYRVHLPYVEVKLSFPESASYTCNVYVERVNEALKGITVLRDFEDIVEKFRVTIQGNSAQSMNEIVIYDFVSDGFLANRLQNFFKGHKNWSFKQGLSAPDSDFFAQEENFFALLPESEDQTWLIGNWNGQSFQSKIEAPMKSPLMKERRRQYFAEMALLRFVGVNSQ